MQPLNPEILRWARESAGLSHSEAAKKLNLSTVRGNTPEDRLIAFEQGREQPEPPMLKKMAKHYRRPLITFYLERPPRASDYGVDYRKVSGQVSAVQDTYLKILVREVIARQGIVRDLLDEDDAMEVDFVDTITKNEGKLRALESLRKIIDSDSPQKEPIREFKKLRLAAEKSGIFVLLQGDLGSHHSIIETSTFRGFVIADRLAPFIVINRNDTRTAHSFTLLHEIVHLILGDTGISGFDAETRAEEQFCNDVASEYLLPSASIATVEVFSREVNELLSILEKLSADWNVSRLLIAYRLYRIGKIELSLYQQISEIIRRQWERNRKQKNADEVQVDFSVVRRHYLGSPLLNLVERYVAEGLLSTTKAAVVLGVKPTQVGTILGMQTRA